MSTSKWTIVGFGAHQSLPNWAALAALDTLDSVYARCKMVEKVCQLTVPKDDHARLNELLKRVRSAAKERNKVAHGRWVLTERKKEDVLLAVNGKLDSFIRYTAVDFRQIAKRFDLLSDELDAFGLMIAVRSAAQTASEA